MTQHTTTRRGAAVSIAATALLAAFAEPVPPMLRWLSFFDALAGVLPGPVAVPPALLIPPWPEPFSAARRMGNLVPFQQ